MSNNTNNGQQSSEAVVVTGSLPVPASVHAQASLVAAFEVLFEELKNTALAWLVSGCALGSTSVQVNVQHMVFCLLEALYVPHSLTVAEASTVLETVDQLERELAEQRLWLATYAQSLAQQLASQQGTSPLVARGQLAARTLQQLQEQEPRVQRAFQTLRQAVARAVPSVRDQSEQKQLTDHKEHLQREIRKGEQQLTKLRKQLENANRHVSSVSVQQDRASDQQRDALMAYEQRRKNAFVYGLLWVIAFLLHFGPARRYLRRVKESKAAWRQAQRRSGQLAHEFEQALARRRKIQEQIANEERIQQALQQELDEVKQSLHTYKRLASLLRR